MAGHVVYIVPVLKSAGAERIVAELATRIPGHGFSTSVLCLEDERRAIGQELLARGATVEGLHLYRRRSLACAAAIRRRLPEIRPLILHAHLFHANLATRLAYRRLQADAARDVHVLSTIHVVERRWRPWQFLLDRLTARWARYEICVSHAVARFHQQRTGLPASFFRVIENGIDLARFQPVERPADRPLRHVVSVGRLDRQKDYPTLLRAWRIVQEKHPDAALCIAGEGPESPRLQRLCRRLNLRRVNFAGFVNDVPALLRRADLYVQSSAWEGFGLTVAEAMAMQLPTIASDADSLQELVSDGKTGLVVGKQRPDLLAGAMLTLMDDPKRSYALGKAACEEARRRFAVERMVEDYAAVYRLMTQSAMAGG